MALKLAEKKQVVSIVHDMVKSAQSAIVAENSGLTVSELDDLRARARQLDVKLRVVRNTLAKRAVENTRHDGLTPALTGPAILVFSYQEPSSAAKLLVEFVKGNEKLTVKALSLGDGLLGADQLEAVSKLPTYDQAIAQLMSVMQAPTTKLVGTLSQTYSKLVRVVAAIERDKASNE